MNYFHFMGNVTSMFPNREPQARDLYLGYPTEKGMELRNCQAWKGLIGFAE